MRLSFGLSASIIALVISSLASICSCNAIMDLGRFSESASATDAGGAGNDAGAELDAGELDAGNDAGGDAGPNWSCMSGPVPPTPTSALLKLFLNDVSSA